MSREFAHNEHHHDDDGGQQRQSATNIAGGFTAYKWKSEPGVLGALEIPSQPTLEICDGYKPLLASPELEAPFNGALQVWEEMKLQEEFVIACNNIPSRMCCCGMVSDNDETIKSYAEMLNKGWMKATNRRLAAEGKHFCMDAFVWTWHNATGKAETCALLIRFFDAQIKEESKKRRH